MLRIENFSFSFNGEPVLQNLNLLVKGGDYLSIIGPNGAGKSTLLKCILRLHERGEYSGNIFVDNRHLKEYHQKELARLISYVPQAGGWIPPYTIGELARLSRFPYASSSSGLNAGDLKAVERALNLTGLTQMAGRQLKSLSGGERQKAYIAAALAQGTKIMLLDEPASFLDPRHAAELNALLRRLNHKEGLTMVVVTHDLNQPLSANSLILVLKNGINIFFGSSAALLDNKILEQAYQHEFTYLTHPQTGSPVVLAD